MYVILKHNICVSVNSVEVDVSSLGEGEVQLAINGMDDPFSVLGKTYSNGEFIETAPTAEEKQWENNFNHRLYLRDTDWMVIRHREQLDAGITPSLTDAEYAELMAKRQ